MTALWTDKDSAVATGGRATAPFRAFGVSIDSRRLKKDDLFIALRGDRNDGHAFLIAARDAGAAAAIVHALPKGAPKDLPYLIVEDTTAALTDMAKAARDRFKGKTVAVTGSVGKTGVKDMIAHVLSGTGSVHKTTGNLNNHIGCPLTLARMPATTDFAVIELGMNHAGEIEPLSRLARPDVALITTIEAVHLEFFDSIDEIADAKAEVFSGAGPESVAILNRDNAFFTHLADKAIETGISRVVGFGEHKKSGFRLLSYRVENGAGHIQADLAGSRTGYTIGAPGLHLAKNSLGVLAAVSAVGVDPVAAAEMLRTYSAMPGRGGHQTIRVRGGAFTLIDESYNASPAATQAALQVLGDTPVGEHGRRIAVLGDMLELGPRGPALHGALAKTVKTFGIDRVFTTGPLMETLFDALPKAKRGGHAASAGEILPLVSAAVRAGDAVTVKGSLGSRMKPVADALRALDRSGLDDLPGLQPGARANGGCA